jgi:outer membrane protein assembly factor BamD (BamD/ComL family)
MSVSGISTTNLFNYNTQNVQNSRSGLQQFQQEFKQLGQDLQSGNLTAAQSDFATLEQSNPQIQAAASSQSNGPIAQAFSQLSQDLQSGNLAGAQQDFSTIQQDIQTRISGGQGHHHHHGGEASAINQAFQELGQALQSGNLSSAQQAYSTLQQDLPQLGQSTAQPAATTSSPSSSTGISVTA